jgi:hypothetical protein
MVYMLQCGIKSPRATQRLVCNPGVVSKTLTCIYDCAAVNWLRIKLTNLRRHAPRMNPGCTKPSTLGVIILRILLLPGDCTVYLSFTSLWLASCERNQLAVFAFWKCQVGLLFFRHILGNCLAIIPGTKVRHD